MVSRRLLACGVLSAAVAGVGVGDGSVSAVDTAVVLGGEALPAKVSAYRGIVAWDSSRYAADGLSRSRQIRIENGAGSVVLAVADGVQDVDVGPGPSGTPVAVYARCPFESQSPVGAPHYFIYARRPVTPPGGCDLYLFDFATAKERKLDVVSTHAGSEYLPTVWGNRIAFARVYPGRRGRRGVYPYIYTARLDGRGTTTRVPGGPRGVYDVSHSSVAFGGAGPVGLDLRAGRLAWTWESAPTHSRVTTELHLATLGGRARVLERATTTGLTDKRHGRIGDARVDALIAPVLTADAVYYARWRNDAVGRYVRRSLATNARSSAPGPSSGWQPTSLAIDGTNLYYTTLDGQLGTCGAAGADHVSPPPFSATTNELCFVRETATPTLR
jgi:hypothetical protein